MLRLSALLWAVVVVLASPAHGECRPYGSDTELRGTIATRDYPGPPNYRDIAAGDQKQTVFLLVLDTPICTHIEADRPAAQNVGEVQLAYDWASPESSKTYLEIASAIGSTRTLSGELFAARAREHRTPVLMVVRASSEAAGAAE